MRFIKPSSKSLFFGLLLALATIDHQAWAESANPPTQSISDLSFMEIRQNKQAMTDIQWEDYSKSLEEKRIQWTGYVEDVTKQIFGGYKVLVDMDPPSDTLSVQDLYFPIPKEQLLIHPRVGAHKLTLTAGYHMIWASPTDSAEEFIQLIHRLYRAGQTQKTLTLLATVTNTIEEEVYLKLQGKLTHGSAFLHVFNSLEKTVQ